jgi:hypothetical protein
MVTSFLYINNGNHGLAGKKAPSLEGVEMRLGGVRPYLEGVEDKVWGYGC